MDSFEDCDDNYYLQDLNNGVINACFMLLFRDLIRLFACYNDGIINLLGKLLSTIVIKLKSFNELYL